jgi:hypothetical protein
MITPVSEPAYEFEATCTVCFEPVPLTSPEVKVRVDADGNLTCDRCKPLAELIEEYTARAEARRLRRVWAAIVLTPYIEVCESILRGRPVSARRLELPAMVRASRGQPPPAPDSYVQLTGEMLDAVDEVGPFR